MVGGGCILDALLKEARSGIYIYIYAYVPSLNTNPLSTRGLCTFRDAQT